MRKINPLIGSLAVVAIALGSIPFIANAQFSSGGGGVSPQQMNTALDGLAATIPQPSGTVPLQPAGVGVIGSGLNYVPDNAQQRLTVQRTTVAVDASGNWSVTWGTAFQSSTPTVNPIPLNASATSPYICNVTTRSANTATGHCWQVTSQTVALISLTISLAPTLAPLSTSVMVIAAEPTQ